MSLSAASEDHGGSRTRNPFTWLLVGLVRAYQLVVSPWLAPRCRYYPSCSAYALTAIRAHGPLRGLVLAAWRLLRCNPWSPGGVDHVPPRTGSRFRRDSLRPSDLSRTGAAAEASPARAES